MSKQFKRLFALMMVLTLVLGLMPTAFAVGISGSGEASRPITRDANEIIDNDVFASIAALEAEAARPMGGQSRMTEADYIALVPQVKEVIENSRTYVPGTLQANGNFLVWETTEGLPCCYDPRMEAELHNTVNDPSPAEIARAEAEAQALVESYTATRGGSATSTKIGLIQPYWESSSSYADSSFTSYSPYYKTMWQNLYGATGGTGIRYSMTNATVDNVASTIEQCGLVIFDSHGTTDYSGSSGDYTSRANCSYLCLTTNTGVTSTDTAAKTGTYGTYYDCLKGSGYAYVSGQCIANHMSSNAPHSLVYMGICLGMATDGMFTGLRNKGVEVVYGYSQSVSFTGEKQYMQSILGYVKDGYDFGTALSKAKSSLGKWDPAYSSYSQSQAVSNHVAFPIAVSSEDAYPGHGNVDAVQTVNSTWTLMGSTSSSYTVTATTNNSSYGTVSVSGYTITATPKTGYYASGYTVTSGTATVSQNGNTFTVTPSSDCTVRINFAAKTQYTVTLKANGSTYSTLSCYSGESVTLPTTATAVSGYTFAGWTTSTVSETTTKPTILTGSYSPSGSVTLYAVYTKTEGTGGATVYELIDTAPSSWAGNWLISYGTSTSSLYFLKGLSGNTKYESTSAGGSVLLSSTGMSYADGQISGATNAYIWKATADSSYYKLQNASTGTYLGSYSSYLYSRSSYSSSYCRWTLTMSSGNVTAKNTASSSYPYLSFSSSKYFMVGSSAPTGLYFWKETSGGTTYYTTSPSTTTHTHSYGSWTSNNNGTHSRSCSCGDTETANCTYTSVVTAPTTTSQGYTTYTCTVCGYSYKSDYTDPISDTTYYTVTYSVPSGVTKPSSQTVEAGGSITLPTAGAPSGYTFLGWVTSTVSSTTTQPSTIYTGTVTVNGSVTLYALYSYTSTSGGSTETAYALLGSAPSTWAGNYLITYGTSTSSLYALKGLSGNTRYESTSAGGSVLYSNAGMTYADGYMTGVSSAYVWTVAATGSYYTIKNASTGTYLGSYSSYLYSRSSYSSSYCRWTLSMDSSGNVTAKNTASSSYPYLSFSSSKYFMVGSSAPTGLYFWQETTTSTGGTSTTYYTTG